MLDNDNSDTVNLSLYITEIARRHPDKYAIVLQKRGTVRREGAFEYLSFGELNNDVNCYARGFKKIGIVPGMRVSFLIPQGFKFLTLFFALLKIGAVPVLIDAGMSKKTLLSCIKSTSPQALIAGNRGQLARLIFPAYFRSIKISVTTDKNPLFRGVFIDDAYMRDGKEPRPQTKRDDIAAILFTSGSTGTPKGALYTHGMFDAQRSIIMDSFAIRESDVDMPTFAVFGIFSISLGCTNVIPEMDPVKPALVNTQHLIECMKNHDVTFSFGSPALWNTVAAYCEKNKVRFAKITKIIMAGAPISPALLRRMTKFVISEKTRILVPYGATEALPVSFSGESEAVSETVEDTLNGRGYCVGKPSVGVKVKIIRITDDPVERLDGIAELNAYEKGEVIVKGPIVSREYFRLPEKNSEHKIYEIDDVASGPWHRMGDVGYFDARKRLWLCGRKSERVETGAVTLFTLCCEAIFNRHEKVFRSALIGIGTNRYQQKPVIIIEPKRGAFPNSKKRRKRFIVELLHLGRSNPLTENIETVLFHPCFPVDIRHNAKIFRKKLSIWAERRVRRCVRS